MRTSEFESQNISVISIFQQTYGEFSFLKMEVDWNEIYGTKPRKQKAIGYLAKRILDELPFEVGEDESWEMTVEQIVANFGASKGSVYEVFHVFEALLIASKVRSSLNLFD